MILNSFVRTEWVAADELLREFGAAAIAEADARARASRDRGNAILFARWRQVERVIALLDDQTVTGTRH